MDSVTHVLNAWSDDYARLERELADVRRDLATCREILTVSLDALADMTRHRDRLSARLQQLLEELRALRTDQRRAA